MPLEAQTFLAIKCIVLYCIVSISINIAVDVTILNFYLYFVYYTIPWFGIIKVSFFNSLYVDLQRILIRV